MNQYWSFYTKLIKTQKWSSFGGTMSDAPSTTGRYLGRGSSGTTLTAFCWLFSSRISPSIEFQMTQSFMRMSLEMWRLSYQIRWVLEPQKCGQIRFTKCHLGLIFKLDLNSCLHHSLHIPWHVRLMCAKFHNFLDSQRGSNICTIFEVRRIPGRGSSLDCFSCPLWVVYF